MSKNGDKFGKLLWRDRLDMWHKQEDLHSSKSVYDKYYNGIISEFKQGFYSKFIGNEFQLVQKIFNSFI